jgi:ABC-type branched-subunit amino acid transport system ATPase component
MIHDDRGGTDRQQGLLVDQVSKHFFALKAVDRVSLTLRQGEILGLIGPNGSGKTTLVNVITGVLAPTAGRILLDDTDITGWKSHRIARVGIGRSFQRVRLFAGMTVLENVVVAALTAGYGRAEAVERAHCVLATMGVASFETRPATALSYGHERMVEVARALAMRPRYLFLDEPAAGLNEGESRDLLARLAPIPKRENLGMLIIDHDMHLIMRLCHRLHVLNYGRTIAEGTPQEVRTVPAVIEAYLGSSVEIADA